MLQLLSLSVIINKNFKTATSYKILRYVSVNFDFYSDRTHDFIEGGVMTLLLQS